MAYLETQPERQEAFRRRALATAGAYQAEAIMDRLLADVGLEAAF